MAFLVAMSPPRGLSLVLLVGLCCASSQAAAEPAQHDLSGFLGRAAEIEDWLISTRRLLHTFPELMFQEHNTSATIRRSVRRRPPRW